MGSKDAICDEIIKLFPKAGNFYDLFGGGFSVTHAMLLRRSKHYKNFHFNEIRPGVCELIQKAIKGEYNYNVFKPKFISREEFLDKLDKDAYIKLCWSFGNNGKDYMFSKQLEPYKKSMHNAIIFNDFDSLACKVMKMDSFKEGYTVKEKRFFLRNKIETYRKTKIPEFLFPYLKEEQLDQLERLERLDQLQQLQRLERLKFYNLSYEKIKIKENSIIYCDPPYLGTVEYDGGFDHKKFYDWASENPNPVFISEYNISDPRLKVVFKIKKRSLISSDKKKFNEKEERVYANQAAIKAMILNHSKKPQTLEQ